MSNGHTSFASTTAPEPWGATDTTPLPEWFRQYLIDRRRSLLMELGQIEDALGMDRSVLPKRQRG